MWKCEVNLGLGHSIKILNKSSKLLRLRYRVYKIWGHIHGVKGHVEIMYTQCFLNIFAIKCLSLPGYIYLYTYLPVILFLFQSGAHFVIDTTNDLPAIIDLINQRLALGIKP